LLGLLKQFGADNVVYQLGVIRLLDEGRRERQDMLAAALEDSDGAMPTELLRLSTGRLKDILHSGNLAYAVRRLREHFFAEADGGDGAEGAHVSPPAARGCRLVVWARSPRDGTSVVVGFIRGAWRPPYADHLSMLKAGALDVPCAQELPKGRVLAMLHVGEWLQLERTKVPKIA
jgi:hypothetical protein